MIYSDWTRSAQARKAALWYSLVRVFATWLVPLPLALSVGRALSNQPQGDAIVFSKAGLGLMELLEHNARSLGSATHASQALFAAATVAVLAGLDHLLLRLAQSPERASLERLIGRLALWLTGWLIVLGLCFLGGLLAETLVAPWQRTANPLWRDLGALVLWLPSLALALLAHVAFQVAQARYAASPSGTEATIAAFRDVLGAKTRWLLLWGGPRLATAALFGATWAIGTLLATGGQRGALAALLVHLVSGLGTAAVSVSWWSACLTRTQAAADSTG